MIQIKRGSTKSWQKQSLAAGQPGYDKDKKKLKIGDGKSSWNDLPYASGLSNDDILSSEEDAKTRRKAALSLNPLNILAALFDSPAVITYGTAGPDEDTVGQIYLQQYDTDPEVDYIVAAGVDKGWIYQKWKSGIAKCNIVFEVSTSVQTSAGALYQNTTTIGNLSYPFNFIEAPSENATVQSPGGLVWLTGAKKLNTTTHSAAYNILSVDKLTDSATYRISLEVVGFWK